MAKNPGNCTEWEEISPKRCLKTLENSGFRGVRIHAISTSDENSVLYAVFF